MEWRNYMLKRFSKKGIAILLIILSLLSVCTNFVYAISNATLIKDGGDCRISFAILGY